jgi:hypothetical protein
MQQVVAGDRIIFRPTPITLEPVTRSRLEQYTRPSRCARFDPEWKASGEKWDRNLCTLGLRHAPGYEGLLHVQAMKHLGLLYVGRIVPLVELPQLFRQHGVRPRLFEELVCFLEFHQEPFPFPIVSAASRWGEHDWPIYWGSDGWKWFSVIQRPACWSADCRYLVEKEG